MQAALKLLQANSEGDSSLTVEQRALLYGLYRQAVSGDADPAHPYVCLPSVALSPARVELCLGGIQLPPLLRRPYVTLRTLVCPGIPAMADHFTM
jgi:hypothetical protein